MCKIFNPTKTNTAKTNMSHVGTIHITQTEKFLRQRVSCRYLLILSCSLIPRVSISPKEELAIPLSVSGSHLAFFCKIRIRCFSFFIFLMLSLSLFSPTSCGRWTLGNGQQDEASKRTEKNSHFIKILSKILVAILVIMLSLAQSTSLITPDGTYKGVRLCEKVRIYNEGEQSMDTFRVRTTTSGPDLYVVLIHRIFSSVKL